MSDAGNDLLKVTERQIRLAHTHGCFSWHRCAGHGLSFDSRVHAEQDWVDGGSVRWRGILQNDKSGSW